MERCYALLVLVRCIELAAVEEFLDGRNLAQSRQLHDILLDGETGLICHLLELMVACGGVVALGLRTRRHLGGSAWCCVVAMVPHRYVTAMQRFGLVSWRVVGVKEMYFVLPHADKTRYKARLRSVRLCRRGRCGVRYFLTATNALIAHPCPN